MPGNWCDHCGRLYEEPAGEVHTTPQGRRRFFCPTCVTNGVVEAVMNALAFDSPLDREVVRRRLAYDDDGE